MSTNIFGNWYGEQSPLAEKHKEIIGYKYAGENDKRVDRVVELLVKEIYTYNDHPAIAAYLKPVEELVFTVRAGEVRDLLRRYGKFNLIYVPLGSDVEAPSATWITAELGLTLEKVGMPLVEFLRHYKGGDLTPREVLEEWSGIKHEAWSFVLQDVIRFFREKINSLHRAG